MRSEQRKPMWNDLRTTLARLVSLRACEKSYGGLGNCHKESKARTEAQFQCQICWQPRVPNG